MRTHGEAIRSLNDGRQVVYRLVPPLVMYGGKTLGHALVSYNIYRPLRADWSPETMIFPCDADGNVPSWTDEVYRVNTHDPHDNVLEEFIASVCDE